MENMRIFKNKVFNNGTGGTIDDDSLLNAAKEIAAGNYEASLGQKVFKKRVAIGNKGKRGGARTIVAFQKGNNMFFMYGFSKGVRANITPLEKKGLQKLAKSYFALNDEDLNKAVKAKELIEIKQEV